MNVAHKYIHPHTPIQNYTKSITSKLYIFLHKNNKIQNIFVYIQYTQTTKIRNIYQSTKIYKQPNLNDTRKIKKNFQNKKIKKIVGEQPAVKWCENGEGGGHDVVLLALCLMRAMPIFAYCVRTQNVFLALSSIFVYYKQNKGLKTLVCMRNGHHTRKQDIYCANVAWQ